jgi:hypothetical protein
MKVVFYNKGLKMCEYATNKEKTKFYFFWRWEYQRRNEQYVKDFYSLKKYVEKRLKKKDIDENFMLYAVEGEAEDRIRKKKGVKIIDESFFEITKDELDKEVDKKALEAIDKFSEKYTMNPREIRSPQKGYTSDYILKRILENKEIIEKDDDFFTEYYFSLSQLLYDCGVKAKINPEDNNKIIADINLNGSSEHASQAVKFYHKFYKDYVPAGQESDENRSNKRFETIIEGLSELLSFLIKDLELTTVTVNDPSRAIGLWLWDYIKENNLTDVSTRRAIAIKAYKKFKLKVNGCTDDEIKFLLLGKVRLKKEDIDEWQKEVIKNGIAGDDSTLRRDYDNAEDCIREVKILALK